jgi:hypothetical protein
MDHSDMNEPFAPRTDDEAILYEIVKNHYPNAIGPSVIMAIPEVAKVYGNNPETIAKEFMLLEDRGALFQLNEDFWMTRLPWERAGTPSLEEANGVVFPVYDTPLQLIVELASLDEAYVFVLCPHADEFAKVVNGLNMAARVLHTQNVDEGPWEFPPSFRLSGSGRSAWSYDLPGECGLIMVDRRNLTKIKKWDPTGFIVTSSMTKDNLRECVAWYSTKGLPDAPDIRVTVDAAKPAPAKEVGQQAFFEAEAPAPKVSTAMPSGDAFPRLADSLRMSNEAIDSLLSLMPYRVMIAEVARTYHATFECKSPESPKGSGFCTGCSQEAVVALRAAIPCIEAYCSGDLA